MTAPRAVRTPAGGLLWCLVLGLAGGAAAAQPPAKADPPEEPKLLSGLIEKAVGWYDLFPDDTGAKMTPVPVLRWRNVVRGQEGEAMMVVWAHAGRPAAVASIYPWEGKMIHEFDSLSRGATLVARDGDAVVWAPGAAGVEFKAVPKAPAPAKTAPERLRQMKALAEGFKATMTGWAADDSDQEALRLLPRPLHRYDFTGVKDRDPTLLDGALFAYVQGTDPEVVLALEAVGPAGKAEWQCAFARATSGGLEVRQGDDLVWAAKKHPANRDPKLPHFSALRLLDK